MKNNILPLDVQPGLFDGEETDDRFESARPDRQRYITVLWMALFNMAAFALVAVAFAHGWAQRVFSSDVTGLTYVIAGVFLVGLVLSFATVWKIACETDCVRAHNPCAGTWAHTYYVDGPRPL